MIQAIKKFGTITTAFGFIFISTSSALALPPQATAHADTRPTSTSAAAMSSSYQPPSSVSAAQKNSMKMQMNGQDHLAAAQLKVCEKQSKIITSILGRITTREQNQIDLFSTIASRVEAFYTQKGKTFPAYSQLVASVATAKTQAENDMTATRLQSTFDCSMPNPKLRVSDFQTTLKTEISDLQAFKTAVKNLIVGVAQAQGANLSATTGTSTTTTTTSPTATTGSSTTSTGGKH